MIGANADAPVPLGGISAGETSWFEITSDIAALIDGGTLAVSSEPAGGSPTGAHTGTIVVTNQVFDANYSTQAETFPKPASWLPS